MEKALHNQIKL